MDSATRSRSSRRWLICVPILSLSLLSRGQNNSSDTFTSLKLREYCKLVGQDQSRYPMKSMATETYACSMSLES